MWDSYRITITDSLGFKEEYFYSGAWRGGTYRDKNQYLQPWFAGTSYSYALVSGQGVISQIRYADAKYFTYSDFNAARQPQTITAGLTGSPRSLRTGTRSLLSCQMRSGASAPQRMPMGIR